MMTEFLRRETRESYGMHKICIALIVVLAGCATQDAVLSTGRARFTEFPETLYSAFKASCEGPAQTFRRPERGFAECRELLPPEATAAVILGYDGTIDDLPELVIRFSTTKQSPDFIVENDIFLNVPQKNAKDVQVRMPDPRVSRTIDTLYRRAGGVPITEPAPPA